MTKRELILKAGARLFAERSYDSVGIRDISNKAGVNSAMISYYFGSKSGLLREIFSHFVQLVIDVSRRDLERSSSCDQMCDLMVRDFVRSARQNRDVYLVGLRLLNRDTPELEDLQTGLMDKTSEYFNDFLARAGLKQKNPTSRGLIFGAVMGMLFSDYLLGGGVNIDDDELLESYLDTITQILKRGLPATVV